MNKFAQMKRRKPIYEPQTFYGQFHWQHIHYVVKISDTCSDARVEPEKPVFLVAFGTASSRQMTPSSPNWIFTCQCILTREHLTADITSVLSLVGRAKLQVGGGGWAIIDRSGALARATYEEEAEADD